MRKQAIRNIEEVLDVSFDYLTKNGLENTSMRDLCNGIGMSLGSMYYWFDSKEDIVVNSAEYGLSKVAGKLFEYAFDTIHDLKAFFDGFLDVVDQNKEYLKFVYQVATSPFYGDRVRKKADGLNETYEKYIRKLSDIIRVPYDKLFPIVFLVISTMLDYVVWEDYDISKIQFDYLYNTLKQMVLENN